MKVDAPFGLRREVRQTGNPPIAFAELIGPRARRQERGERKRPDALRSSREKAPARFLPRHGGGDRVDGMHARARTADAKTCPARRSLLRSDLRRQVAAACASFVQHLVKIHQLVCEHRQAPQVSRLQRRIRLRSPTCQELLSVAGIRLVVVPAKVREAPRDDLRSRRSERSRQKPR